MPMAPAPELFCGASEKTAPSPCSPRPTQPSLRVFGPCRSAAHISTAPFEFQASIRECNGDALNAAAIGKILIPDDKTKTIACVARISLFVSGFLSSYGSKFNNNQTTL